MYRLGIKYTRTHGFGPSQTQVQGDLDRMAGIDVNEVHWLEKNVYKVYFDSDT